MRLKYFHAEKQTYKPIAQLLPMYYENASPPRPCPGDLASLLSGAVKRVANEPPKTTGRVLRKFKNFVKMWLRKTPDIKPLNPDEILNFEEWISDAPYSENRKNQLREVWKDCGGKPTRKQLALIKAFTKDESYPEFKFPRGIYSRSDAAKCLFGPIVASVAKKVFSMHWFIKNIPVVDRPKAIYDKLYKPGAKYMFTDYTAFESHFTADIMDICENQLYDYMFSQASESQVQLIRLMCKTKMGWNNVVTSLCGFKLKAKRMSGEMDTSLSNGFANLMLALFTAQQAGIDRTQITGFVEGDDGLFRFDHESLPTTEDFASVGFTIKIETTEHLERASFCGQVYDLEDLTVVTDIREQVCRLGLSSKKYVRAGPAVCRELLRAKGFSLAHQYAGVPVLATLGKKILELTRFNPIRQSIVDNMDWWEKQKYVAATSEVIPDRPVGMNTRNLVEELYNVSVVEQIDIENRISAMTELGPLPFQFLELPDSWKRYWENYHSGQLDDPPLWLPNKERESYERLLDSGVINPTQFHQLIRGQPVRCGDVK